MCSVALGAALAPIVPPVTRLHIFRHSGCAPAIDLVNMRSLQITEAAARAQTRQPKLDQISELQSMEWHHFCLEARHSSYLLTLHRRLEARTRVSSRLSLSPVWISSNNRVNIGKKTCTRKRIMCWVTITHTNDIRIPLLTTQVSFI